MTDRHRLHFTGQNLFAARPAILDEILGNGLAWVDDGALCAQTDPELFFAEIHGERLNAGRALCARCPLQQACLEDALARPEFGGLWGGTTARQRRRIRRERAAQEEAA